MLALAFRRRRPADNNNEHYDDDDDDSAEDNDACVHNALGSASSPAPWMVNNRTVVGRNSKLCCSDAPHSRTLGLRC